MTMRATGSQNGAAGFGGSGLDNSDSLALGEATGISIFMASTKAMSSPLPTLAPV
jgi:hypothetical protein